MEALYQLSYSPVGLANLAPPIGGLQVGCRYSAGPVVTVVGIQIGYLLGGTAVVETVFGIQGLGDFAVRSVLAGDLPAIQGMVVFAVLITVTASLVVDMTYGYLNPRGESQ